MASHLGARIGKVRPRSTQTCVEKARARGVKDPVQFCRVKRK